MKTLTHADTANWFHDFPITDTVIRLVHEGNISTENTFLQLQIAYFARRILYAYAKAIILKKNPFPIRCRNDGFMDGIEDEANEWLESLGFKVFVKPRWGTLYIHYLDHQPSQTPIDNE